MPSNKDKVASYLETDEVQALDKFCKEKECSRSQAVSYLIREKLMENEDALEESVYRKWIDERLEVVEKASVSTSEFRVNQAHKNEKLEKLIAELQEDVCRLKAEIKESTIYSLSDEQIASVTGRRMEEARNWRMGVRKPRGKNILKALKPYEVVDGLWKKKSM